MSNRTFSQTSLKDTRQTYLFTNPSLCNCPTYLFDIVGADGSTGNEVASGSTGRGVIVDAGNGRSQRHPRWIPWLRTHGRIVERSGKLTGLLVFAALLLLAFLSRGTGSAPSAA